MKLKNLIWSVVTTAITIILIYGYIVIQEDSFDIYLNNGDQLAKYKEGKFKLYSGRYVVLEDYVSPECYYDRASRSW